MTGITFADLAKEIVRRLQTIDEEGVFKKGAPSTQRTFLLEVKVYTLGGCHGKSDLDRYRRK